MATQSKSSNQKNARQGRGRGGQQQSRESEGMMSRGMNQVESMVEDQEGRAILIALAAGFGLGYLLGCSLGSSKSESSRWSERITAEGLGHRLMENLDRILPEAISSRLSH